MIPKSIRWRLPLSYAAIALLAALVLGFVLLTTLRSFYRQRELDYLRGNARAISLEIANQIGLEGIPAEILEGYLTSLSFLSQTQVRLLDKEGNVLVDSGAPQARYDLINLPLEFNVELDIESQRLADTPGDEAKQKLFKSVFIIHQAGDQLPGDDSLLKRQILISSTERTSVEILGTQVENVTEEVNHISSLSAAGTPYGFGLNAESAASGRRSDQVVRYETRDASGHPSGYIELSNGPAYGREVLTSVAWGWALASAVAVLLAAGAGWLISRRLSTPLLALAEVTAQMARGDLSVRAELKREDEVGHLAQAFNHMARQVEETVVTLRRFVADAAHELNTPLTALTTNLELAANDPERDNPAPFIKRAQAQVTRLKTLTNDLLDLSRLEAGTAETAQIPIDLVALAQETGERYASQAEQMDLTFSLKLAEEAVILRGNAPQLRRALGNLLDNALKFTPPGGEVRLSLSRENESAILTVEDTGIGIPPADLPQIFSRFHRGRNTATYPGSGLGLAIVKAIAERHNGQVKAGTTNQGTRFLVKLPLICHGA